MEKDKEKEIKLGRTQTPEWDRVKAQETEERGCSIQITISSGNESQIERPRVGKPELESERKVESNVFNEKQVTSDVVISKDLKTVRPSMLKEDSPGSENALNVIDNSASLNICEKSANHDSFSTSGLNNLQIESVAALALW
ncbi:UNVERIFIED_CONTAM: hypothetical protein RMT77_019710 [Armadillidium vulgare]